MLGVKRLVLALSLLEWFGGQEALFGRNTQAGCQAFHHTAQIAMDLLLAIKKRNAVTASVGYCTYLGYQLIKKVSLNLHY